MMLSMALQPTTYYVILMELILEVQRLTGYSLEFDLGVSKKSRIQFFYFCSAGTSI